jgi:hypothetical protein
MNHQTLKQWKDLKRLWRDGLLGMNS